MDYYLAKNLTTNDFLCIEIPFYIKTHCHSYLKSLPEGTIFDD